MKVGVLYLILEGSGIHNILQAIVTFVLLVILMAIAMIDADRHQIPNTLIGAVLACGIIAALLFSTPDIKDRIMGMLAVSGPMMILSFFRAGAFGGGDIKLMAAAGVFLGWQNAIVSFLIALLLGGIYSIYLMLSGRSKWKGQFAFGPFLCIGIGIALFAGEHIVQWYMRISV